MGIGFEEETALSTILKRKYHLINPDFDNLLLHISYEVNYFQFFKWYDFFIILKTSVQLQFPLNSHAPGFSNQWRTQ